MRRVLHLAAAAVLLSASAWAQGPSRKIGELELQLLGVSATVDPLNPTVPKNVASGVRIVVRAGAHELSAADVARFLGAGYGVEAELSGPGLAQVVTLPQRLPGDPLPADPLLLPLPGLTAAGDYSLANIRIVANGRSVLGVTPSSVTLKVIDQILITSVKTRPLTLAEIKEKGIVLDSDSYLGFEFTLGLKLESKVVNLTLPVVFDKKGVAVPQPALPPPPPDRIGLLLPTVVPLLLEADGGEGLPGGSTIKFPLTLPNGEPIRIPSVLVIPGNVGYLKQFFSAQLFVANGAPVGSGLVVRDVTGTIKLPPGEDQQVGTADDPLTLPATVRGPQSETMPIRSVGPDELPGTDDDVSAFHPAEQGQGEFLIRGEKEGFHTLNFDINATLDGLPVGPVKVRGKASGGVLVRNPFFDVTFTVPSVVRKNERFKMFVSVTNIGQGIGNDVSVTLDASRMSGAHLVADGTQRIDTLRTGDSRTLVFDFQSERTGQVVASYLHFDTQGSASGDLKFTLGVGERGIALSPDTLVLPTDVSGLPQDVVDAAMRVLGQGWSIANAPSGTLPLGVSRTSKGVVTQKALALAEAGLRVSLGQPPADAVRDLVFDFFGGSPLDPGFDQLLRETEAGRDLAQALGAAVAPAALAAGGAVGYEDAVASIAASGPDFVTLAASGASGNVSLTDGSGRRLSSSAAGIPGAVLLPLGATGALGVATLPTTPPYTIELQGRETGSTDLAVTLPRGDGSFVRGLATLAVSAGSRTRVTIDLARTDALRVQQDADGDGVFESERSVLVALLPPHGPELLSATVVGPETFPGATPFGQQVALLFDRLVDETTSARKETYSIPDNTVRAAKRQLSGRLVFASLDQPEGPYVPTTVSASGVADTRGSFGLAGTVALQSRMRDLGAVVSGRVLNADGTPARGASVVYTNNVDLACEEPIQRGVAALPVAADGHFEFRYVRQDACGSPFGVVTQDPTTGATRNASGFVRVAGEQIVLDIALFGRGSVAGVVRDLSGQPVAGARVVALSVTDPQVGGGALTDLAGGYRIDGITVGPISVQAGRGASLGRTAGRIARAGTTAIVDVTIDGGAVRVSGTVRKLENGALSPIPAVGLVYQLAVGGDLIPVGISQTATDGSYTFEAMPVGAFVVTAALNTRDQGMVSGIAGAGDNLTGKDILIEVASSSQGFGTVRGVVRLPGGAPFRGAIVSQGASGVLSRDDGSFELPGISVRPNEVQALDARTRDRLRFGKALFVLNGANEVKEGVDIVLSGLAAAEYLVLDPQERPVPNQQVFVFPSDCAEACGCRPQATGADGRTRYENQPLGSLAALAIRVQPTFIDVAGGTAPLERDGATGFTTLRFAGAGSVSGVVFDPDGRPAFGVDVALSSRHFLNTGIGFCGLDFSVSHRARTDTAGRFHFSNVNVGPIRILVTHPFFPTSVGAQGTLVADGQNLDFTLRLVNTTSGELSGAVFLPDGITPAGAGVEVTANGPLPDVTVRTNDQGRYHFPKIFPEGQYTLTARDPVTGGVAQNRVFLRAAHDLSHDVRLKGRGTVRVRVVDGADQAVPSAFVRLAETEFPSRVREGAVDSSNQGIAVFENVFEGPVSAEASDAFARGGRASSVLPRPGSTIEIKVKLTTTGRVAGRFLMRDRATPIPFGTVRLVAGGRAIGQATTAGSGDVGSFAFDFVPAGPVRLEAEDPLTARKGVAVGSLLSEGEHLTLDVIAQGLGGVSGRVTSNGAVQPAARVQIASGFFNASTVADSVGHYVVDGIPEGRVVVTASLDNGFLSGTAAGDLIGDNSSLSLNVSLRGSGQVAGQVVTAGGSAGPVSSVSIQSGGTGGGSQSTVTDETGHFEFTRVPAGPATLRAAVLDSIDFGSATLDVPSGGSVQATVPLVGLGTVRVTVRDAAGAIVPGAQVSVTSSHDSFRAFNGVTGPDGAATLTEVLSGTLEAIARDPVRHLSGTGHGALAAAGTAELSVGLEAAGRVAGTIRRFDGTAAAGARVQLLRSFSSLGVTTADAAGLYAVDSVTLGDVLVDARDDATGDRGRASGVLLLNGATASIDVTLNGVGIVHVTVRDAAGAVVTNADVQVTSGSPLGGFYSGKTGSDGTVSLFNVLAGPLTLTANDPVRHIGGGSTASLAPGAAVDVEVRLAPVATLRGHVLLPNGHDPAPGVIVNLLRSDISDRVVIATATTDSAGGYEITNLPIFTMPQKVVAEVDGRVRAFSTADLRTGLLILNFTLRGAGTVRGTVRDSAGNPLLSQPVQLDCSDAPLGLGRYAFAVTNDFGVYEIAGWPLCSFTISSSTPSGDRADAHGTLSSDGQTVTVDLRLLSSAVTLPIRLTDGNGLSWTLHRDGVSDGLGIQWWFLESFGSAPVLSLVRDGSRSRFLGDGDLVATQQEKREMVLHGQVAGLEVTRKVYVPPLGYFVRYLDTLRNPGPDPVVVDLVEDAFFQGFPGAPPNIVDTSSGDALLDATDRFVVVDDENTTDYYDNPRQNPPVAFVVAGDGNVARPALLTNADYSSGELSYRWNGVVVPPGGAVTFLHAFSAQADRARARASAERLSALPPELLSGMTPAEAESVVNFSVPQTLASSLEPLLVDGIVTGRVLAGDGVTPAPFDGVRFRSRSPYFGAPIQAFPRSDDGSYEILPFLDTSPPSPRVVPRAPFDVSARYQGPGTAITASASGDFPSVGPRDLTSTSGVSFRTSSGSLAGPTAAVDANLDTNWQWAVGDAASAPYFRLPFFEILFPSEVTLEKIRFRGARFPLDANLLRVRFEVRDASGSVVWTNETDLPAPTRDIDVDVPAVSGRSLRLVDVLDATDSPAFSEIQVLGEGGAGATGRAEVDLVFSGTGVLEGRVQRSGGTGVPLAYVYARYTGGYSSAYSDAEGLYRAVLPPASYDVTAYLPANSDVTAAGSAAVVAGQKTRLDLTFPALGGVEGSLRLADASAAYATVTVSPRAGFYRFADSTTGSYTRVDLLPATYTIEATEYRSGARLTRVVAVAAGAPTVADFTFPPIGRVDVRVTLDGVPVQGAEVQLQTDARGPAWSSGGFTDVLGRVSIFYVPGPAFRVRAFYPGSVALFREAGGALSQEGEQVSVSIDLPRADTVSGTVSGTIRRADGNPAAGVAVEILGADGRRLALVTTGGDGRYSYGLAPVGPIAVRAFRFSYAGGSPLEERGAIASAGASTPIDADLPGAIRFAGDRDVWRFSVPPGYGYGLGYLSASASVARDPLAALAGLADPFLEVYDANGSLVASNDNGSSSTRDSYVSFTSPEQGGVYRLVARDAASGTGAYRVDVSVDLVGALPISSERGEVAGRVTRRDDGAVVSGQRVRLTGGSPAFVRTVATDAAGQFRIRGVPPGAWTLEALDSDVAIASGTMPDEGAAQSQDLVVSHGLVSIRGTLATQDGHPLAGITLRLSTGATTVTDASGVFSFAGLPAGSYTIDALLARPSSTPVTFAGGEQVVYITVSVPILRGRIAEADGSAASASVTACGNEEMYPYAYTCVSHATDSQGRYVFYDLPVFKDSWGVSVTAEAVDGSNLAVSDRYYQDPQNFILDRTLNLSFPATATITGRVTEADGTPAAGAGVTLMFAGRAASADSAGFYRFAHVFFPATVRVYAEAAADGIPGVSATAQLVAASVVNLDVSLAATGQLVLSLLDPQAGRIAGAVTLAALEAPTANPPLPWLRALNLTSQDNPVRVPAGPFRVTDSGPQPAAAEGLLAAGEVRHATLREGSHIHFTIDPSFVESHVPNVEPYPDIVKPEQGGAANRSLLVSGAGVRARRKVYTQPSGRFTRTFTSLFNPGPSAVTVDLQSALELSSSATWTLLSSSSGDAVFDATDSFAVASPNTQVDPTTAIVIGDLLPPTGADFIGSGEAPQFRSTHLLTIEPGQTRGILLFAVRGNDRAAVEAEAAQLTTLADVDALSGFTALELQAIANFNVGPLTGVSGTVTAQGAAVAGARVGVVSGATILGESTTDDAGRFLILRIADGDYAVVAVDTQNRPGRAAVTVAGGTAPDVHVELVSPDQLGSVSVQASAPGVSLEGVAIRVAAQGFSPLWTATALLDAQGRATFTGVPPGAVTVTSGTAGFAGQADGVLGAGGILSLTLVLDVHAVVSGSVRTSAGDPVPDAQVSLVLEFDLSRSFEATADARGEFLLSVPPGDYLVFASDPVTRLPGQSFVSALIGQPSAVTVFLLAPTNVFTLHVHGILEGTGAPAAGAVVDVGVDGWSPFWSARVTLDGSGEATVSDVPDGLVFASSGAPPDYGYEAINVFDNTPRDLFLRIGQRAFFPIDLTGADGMHYFARSSSVVEATGTGGDWVCDPFCTGYSALGAYLTGGLTGYDALTAGRILQGGREVALGPETDMAPGLVATRRVFVPPNGRFVRVLDVLENTASTPLDLKYELYQAHSTPLGFWTIGTTSTGDALFDAADSFVTMSSPDPAAPEMAWVIGGPGSSVTRDFTFRGDAGATLTYFDDQGHFTLGPGQRAILMRFAIQKGVGTTPDERDQARADVLALAQALMTLDDTVRPEALLGLTADEKALIVNFVVPPQ